jgi:hypothetical protein
MISVYVKNLSVSRDEVTVFSSITNLTHFCALQLVAFHASKYFYARCGKISLFLKNYFWFNLGPKKLNFRNFQIFYHPLHNFFLHLLSLENFTAARKKIQPRSKIIAKLNACGDFYAPSQRPPPNVPT